MHRILKSELQGGQTVPPTIHRTDTQQISVKVPSQVTLGPISLFKPQGLAHGFPLLPGHPPAPASPHSVPPKPTKVSQVLADAPWKRPRPQPPAQQRMRAQTWPLGSHVVKGEGSDSFLVAAAQHTRS